MVKVDLKHKYQKDARTWYLGICIVYIILSRIMNSPLLVVPWAIFYILSKEFFCVIRYLVIPWEVFGTILFWKSRFDQYHLSIRSVGFVLMCIDVLISIAAIAVTIYFWKADKEPPQKKSVTGKRKKKK